VLVFRYFEGTGVLVLDRVNGVVYCSLSERADQRVAERWAAELGYKDLVLFQSSDKCVSIASDSTGTAGWELDGVSLRRPVTCCCEAELCCHAGHHLTNMCVCV
jgi:hypothetical protein